jgi:hypothetical protein
MEDQDISRISLGQIVQIARQRKQLIFATVGGILLLTILYLQVATPTYPVSMQVAPAVGSGPQAGGGLGALAKLGGVNLGDASGGGLQFELFRKALTTRETGDKLARNQPLMRLVFPAEWSQSEGRWVEPRSLLRPVVNAVKWLLGIPNRAWAPPNGTRVAQYVSDNLEIYEDTKSPILTLAIQSDRPAVTQQFLVSLADAVDRQLRERALQRAVDYTSYLTSELQKETVTQYRQSLIDHLAEQQQTLMMASARVSFSMQVFSEPSYPQKPTEPKALILLISGLVFGFLFGVILALWSERRRLRWSQGDQL